MDLSQAEAQLRQNVHITRSHLVSAKAIVLTNVQASIQWQQLVAAVYEANDVSECRSVIVHPSADTASDIRAAANTITWQLATIEAIWGLVHAGLVIADFPPFVPNSSVQYSTISPIGGGGTRGGWQFPEFELPVPPRLYRSPSWRQGTNEFLSDPDLYINALSIPNMHPDVAMAFQDAVRCFRQDLFTAALAMLGKASEGAWLDVGAALLKKIARADEASITKQQEILEDSSAGVLRKVKAVQHLYAHASLKPLVKAAGIPVSNLDHVATWSDAVRDSRNTVHFGVASSTPNTYDKVAALLIGAAPQLRTLYRIKAAAETA